MMPLFRSNCWAAAIVVCVSIILGSLGASASFKGVDSCKFDSLRLPERVKPSHYELRLKLNDINGRLVEGQVKINVTVGPLSESCESSKSFMRMFKRRRDDIPLGCNKREIILNANERIKFANIQYIVDRGLHNNRHDIEEIKIDGICRDLNSELTSIKLHKKLEDNSHGQLVIDFLVTPNDKGREGLYRSTWRDQATGSNQVSFVTQFEAASARKAFPCFDEPALKATFDLIIDHDKGFTALANTLPIKQEPIEATESPHRTPRVVRTHFERTPVMSSYLLAFAVGRFDHLESKIMDEKMLLRVFTPVGEEEKAKYFLDTSRRAYAVLHDYFDLEQPIKKIDFLPIQIGFGSAMENWGLVTFMDNLLLVEPNTNSHELASRAKMISHELAHHWFGNLVTMKWWDNLWLNEAFAQLMGYMVANEIHPEFNMNILFVQNELMKGLKSDANVRTTHPIKNPNLKTIKDIGNSFDDITYKKGASVMRMIESYVGHESFKLALRDYLNKFKFQNTDEGDLWSAIEARSRVPVARMMHTWLNQAGFPIVTVRLLDNNKIHVRQDRFEREPTAEGQKQLWLIPVNMVVVHGDQSELVKFVLSDREQEITLPDWFDATQGHWFKLNTEAGGFFRVHYDSRALALMEKPIRAKEMSVIDRMNMMDDMAALYSIRKVNYLVVQDFLEWFDRDESPAVIYALTGMVDVLRTMSLGQSNKHLMLVDYYERMKTNPVDEVQEINARENVLFALIKSNYKPAIDEGLKRFQSAADSFQYPEMAAVARAGDSWQIARLRAIIRNMNKNRRDILMDTIFDGVDKERTDQVLKGLSIERE